MILIYYYFPSFYFKTHIKIDIQLIFFGLYTPT